MSVSNDEESNATSSIDTSAITEEESVSCSDETNTDQQNLFEEKEELK